MSRKNTSAFFGLDSNGATVYAPAGSEAAAKLHAARDAARAAIKAARAKRAASRERRGN